MGIILAYDCGIDDVVSFRYTLNGKEGYGEGSLVFRNFDGSDNYPRNTEFTLNLNSGKTLSLTSLGGGYAYGGETGKSSSTYFGDAILATLKKSPRKGYSYATLTPREKKEYTDKMQRLAPEFDMLIKEGNVLGHNGWTAKDIAEDLGRKVGIKISWNVPNYWVDSFTAPPGTPIFSAIISLSSVFRPVVKLEGNTFHILDANAQIRDFTEPMLVGDSNVVRVENEGVGIKSDTRFTLKGGTGGFNADMWRGKTYTQDVSMWGELWDRQRPTSPLIQNKLKRISFQGELVVYENTQETQAYDTREVIPGRTDLKSSCLEIDTYEARRRNVKGEIDVKLYSKQVMYDMTPNIRGSRNPNDIERGERIEQVEEVNVYSHLDPNYEAPVLQEQHKVKSMLSYNIAQDGITRRIPGVEKYTRFVVREFVSPIEYEFLKCVYDDFGVLTKQIRGKLAAVCSNGVCTHWDKGKRVCSLWAGTYDPSDIKVDDYIISWDSSAEKWRLDATFDFNNCIPPRGGSPGVQSDAVCVHWHKEKKICTLDPRIAGSAHTDSDGNIDWDRYCSGHNGKWAPKLSDAKGAFDPLLGRIQPNKNFKVAEQGCRFYTLGNREDCPYRSITWKELSSINKQDEITPGTIIQHFAYPYDLYGSYGNITLLSFIDIRPESLMSIRNLVELEVQGYEQIDSDTYRHVTYTRRVSEGDVKVQIEENNIPSSDAPRGGVAMPRLDVVRTEYNAPNWSIRDDGSSYSVNIYDDLGNIMDEPAMSDQAPNVISWGDIRRIGRHLYERQAKSKYTINIDVAGLVHAFDVGDYFQAKSYIDPSTKEEREGPSGYLTGQTITKDGQRGVMAVLTLETYDGTVIFPKSDESVYKNLDDDGVRYLGGGIFG